MIKIIIKMTTVVSKNTSAGTKNGERVGGGGRGVKGQKKCT